MSSRGSLNSNREGMIRAMVVGTSNSSIRVGMAAAMGVGIINTRLEQGVFGD